MADELLPSQRAEVFDWILEAGLNPREFELTTRLRNGGEREPALEHKPTGYWFHFSRHGGEHYVRFSPGADRSRWLRLRAVVASCHTDDPAVEPKPSRTVC